MATKRKTAPAPASAASDIAFGQQDSTTSILNSWRALVAAFDNRLWLFRRAAHARHHHHGQRAEWFKQGFWCVVIGVLRLVARWSR